MSTRNTQLKEAEGIDLLRFAARYNRLDAAVATLKAVAEPGLHHGLSEMAARVRAEMEPVFHAYSMQLDAPHAYAALRMAGDVLQEALLESLHMSHSFLRAEAAAERRAHEEELRSTSEDRNMHRHARFLAEARVEQITGRLEKLENEMRQEIDDRRMARRAHCALRSDLLDLRERAKDGLDADHLKNCVDEMLFKLDNLTPLSWGPRGLPVEVG